MYLCKILNLYTRKMIPKRPTEIALKSPTRIGFDSAMFNFSVGVTLELMEYLAD